MTFPETVKTTLWDIIDEMSRSLSSFVKNLDKDFIRKRKLDFKKMMHLIISMESGMIIPELSEPPVRTLGATIPENESHIFR